jgi:hypothetical protein
MDDYLKELVKKQEQFDLKLRMLLATKFGLDKAVELLNSENLIWSPYSFIRRAVRMGYITPEEINLELVNAAEDAAQQLADDEPEELGSSDIAAYVWSFLKDAGYNMQVQDARYVRLDNDGNIVSYDWEKFQHGGELEYEWVTEQYSGFKGSENREVAEQELERLKSQFPNKKNFKIIEVPYSWGIDHRIVYEIEKPKMPESEIEYTCENEVCRKYYSGEYNSGYCSIECREQSEFGTGGRMPKKLKISKTHRDSLMKRLWDERGYDYPFMNALTDKELIQLYDTEFYHEEYAKGGWVVGEEKRFVFADGSMFVVELTDKDYKGSVSTTPVLVRTTQQTSTPQILLGEKSLAEKALDRAKEEGIDFPTLLVRLKNGGVFVKVYSKGGKTPEHNQKLDMKYQSKEDWERNYKRRRRAKQHPRQMAKGGWLLTPELREEISKMHNELEETKDNAEKHQEFIRRLYMHSNVPYAKGGETATEIRMSEIKAGDVFVRTEPHFGTTTFVAMSSLKQSKSRKNEYYIEATVLYSTGDYYEKFDEVPVWTNVRNGKVGKAKLIGTWQDGQVKKLERGGEVQLGSNVNFLYGRDNELRHGYIIDVFPDGYLAIQHGTKQSLVNPEKILGIREPERKRFLGYFESGGTVADKVLSEQPRKSMRGDWMQETLFLGVDGRDWQVTTMKRHDGLTKTTAKQGEHKDLGDGWRSFNYTPFEDLSYLLISEKAGRSTRNFVEDQHKRGLEVFKDYLENL